MKHFQIIFTDADGDKLWDRVQAENENEARNDIAEMYSVDNILSIFEV